MHTTRSRVTDESLRSMNPESESLLFERFRFMNPGRLKIQIHDSHPPKDSARFMGFIINCTSEDDANSRFTAPAWWPFPATWAEPLQDKHHTPSPLNHVHSDQCPHTPLACWEWPGSSLRPLLGGSHPHRLNQHTVEWHTPRFLPPAVWPMPTAFIPISLYLAAARMASSCAIRALLPCHVNPALSSGWEE